MMSLRLRLVLIILLPLLIIAGIVGYLALRDAQTRAAERFDQSLLSAAFAISRDVAVSGGDALSPETNALIRDSFNGPVFYHVYAPDGVFVTGYATPPRPPARDETDGDQIYFDGTYQGAEVRGVRFIDAMQIDGLSGNFTFTVWQNQNLRRALVTELTQRTFLIIATLIASVALVVWFGVRTGLGPLLDLESAIAKRSPDDLTPIRRKVPVEAEGIANRLNQLFGQVTQAMDAKNTFISNAAHQLRNPIAGVVAMSEAVGSAPNYKAMRNRSDELTQAAKGAGDLAEKLLTLDRASTVPTQDALQTVNLSALLENIHQQSVKQVADKGVTISLNLPSENLSYQCDDTMMREAITNLIDNALLHGGPKLSQIAIDLGQNKNQIEIRVTDNGKGIPTADLERVKDRFVQSGPSQGSGLGLAITEAVVQQLNGKVQLNSKDGTEVTISLPKGQNL